MIRVHVEVAKNINNAAENNFIVQVNKGKTQVFLFLKKQAKTALELF